MALADILTGLYASNACLAAYAHRQKTGEGQHVDLALMDVQVATLANQALNYLVSGTAPRRLGNAHPNIVPYQAFPTADGWLVLAVATTSSFAGSAPSPDWTAWRSIRDTRPIAPGSPTVRS